MKPAVKKQIRFMLEQENRVMSDALDIENKQMIQNIIQRNKDVLTRLDKNCLTQEDLQLIRDANDICLNDHENLADHYEQIRDADSLGEIDNTIRYGEPPIERCVCPEQTTPMAR